MCKSATGCVCGWVGVQVSDGVRGEVCKSAMGWMCGEGGVQINERVMGWVGRCTSQ